MKQFGLSWLLMNTAVFMISTVSSIWPHLFSLCLESNTITFCLACYYQLMNDYIHDLHQAPPPSPLRANVWQSLLTWHSFFNLRYNGLCDMQWHDPGHAYFQPKFFKHLINFCPHLNNIAILLPIMTRFSNNIITMTHIVTLTQVITLHIMCYLVMVNIYMVNRY